MLSEIVIRALKDRFIQILLVIFVAAFVLHHVDRNLLAEGVQRTWQLLMWIMD